MKIKLLLILTMLFTAGCVNQSKLALLNDPNKWSELNCSGFKTWNDCNTEAMQLCPTDYYVKNQLENLLIQRRVVEIACKG